MTNERTPATAPPTPEPAATLILLRRASSGTEVLMQVRHSDMVFAGGALVFPGGKLEAQDSDPCRHDLMDESGYGDSLGPARVAAIRETFEECGLLLACEAGTHVLAQGARVSRLDRDRQRLNRSELDFGDLLRRESLQLACDALVHYAHWVTPSFMPRRFDTHFFLALAPTSQEDAHDGRETVESVWIRPREALDAAEDGRYRMLFPTRAILHRLSGEQTPESHLRIAAATPVVTVAPRLVEREAGTFVQIPDNIGYSHCEERITRG